MELGSYAAFIVIAYAATIVIVAGLVAWVVLDRRHLLRAIEQMQAQGVGRRSERKFEDKQ
jgi:heme exporter protein D